MLYKEKYLNSLWKYILHPTEEHSLSKLSMQTELQGTERRGTEISAESCRALPDLLCKAHFFKDWKWVQEGVWALG